MKHFLAILALSAVGSAQALTDSKNFDNLGRGLPTGWIVSNNSNAADSRGTMETENSSITSSGALTAIPEPATYMLLGTGLLICGQIFLRKRN